VPEIRVCDSRVPQVSPFLRDLGSPATTLPREPCKLRTNPSEANHKESKKIRQGLSVTSELRGGPPRSRKTSETWGTRPDWKVRDSDLCESLIPCYNPPKMWPELLPSSRPTV